MRSIKCYFMLCFSFLLFCSYSNVMAGGNITILDHTIKAVATVSGGRYIKIAWKVRLRNESDKPMNCTITVAFLDENRKNLGTATKKSKIGASESKTVADTVVLRTTIAQKIKTGEVSVDVDTG